MDRFLHHAEIITISGTGTGKSYRLRHRDGNSKLAKAPTRSKKSKNKLKLAKAPTRSTAENKNKPNEKGGLNNPEFIFDADGKIVRLRDWSSPAELLADLEKLVGPVAERSLPKRRTPSG